MTISCTLCVPLSKSLLLTTLLCQGGVPSWGGGSTAVGQGSEAMGQREAEGGRAAVQLPGCRWRARTAAGTEEQSRTWGAARRLGGPRSGGAAHSAAARSASGVDLAALGAAQSTAGAEHGAPLPSLGLEPSQEAPAPRPHPEGVSHPAVAGLCSPMSRMKKRGEVKLKKEVSEIPSRYSCSWCSSSAKGQKEGSVKLALNWPPRPATGTQSPKDPLLRSKAGVSAGHPWGWGQGRRYPPVHQPGTENGRAGPCPGAAEGAAVGVSLAGDVLGLLLTWWGQGTMVGVSRG